MDEGWLNEIDAKLLEDTETVTLSWDDVYRLIRLGRIGIEAMRFYDALDVDHLDPEYFGSGSDGRQYRGLRTLIRVYREMCTE